MATPSGLPTTFVGRKNIYTCDTCGCDTITVDRDPGVTPFSIRCTVSKECRGRMFSRMYRVDQTLDASHEWCRPPASEVLTEGERQHVGLGGLLLRRIRRRSHGEGS